MTEAGPHWLEHRLAPGVRAISTLRGGSDDDYGWTAGASARHRLQAACGWTLPPVWLQQVHGVAIVDVDRMSGSEPPVADAALTRRPGQPVVVLTADCLPVFLAAADTRVLAVVHAGWRGLVAGVIEAAMRALAVDPARLVACYGPAIGASAFEVGPEVREAFLGVSAEADVAFRPGRAGRWQADLYALAGQRLAAAGVVPPPPPAWCTVTEARFHSWRRDGSAAGRMAHAAWIEAASC